MADSVPEGFTLDKPQTHDLSVPEGFTLDKPSIPGTEDQSSFENDLKSIMTMQGVPEPLHNTVIGLVQGLRDLGHGVSERAVALGNAGVNSLPIPDIAKNVITGSQNQTVNDMQAQEHAFEMLHPSDSVVPGVNDSTAIDLSRSAAHIIPYFVAPEGKALVGNIIGGASQPMQPGENPLTSPISSAALYGATALPFSVLNKAIIKGYNSGALRDTIKSMGIPKAEIDANGPYGAIKNLADNADSFPPGSPEAIQAGKAKAFVNTIESKIDTPTAALALRSDVGGKYLANSVQATRLYQVRNALGDSLGPLDTQPLSEQINLIMSKPENQLNLGSNAGTLRQVMSVLDRAGPDLSGLKGGDLAFVKSNPQALAQYAGQGVKLSYSDLAAMSDSMRAAAKSAQGDPAGIVYKQVADKIDGYLSDLSQRTGGKLAKADSEANAYYKSNVVPFKEKGIATALSDPQMNSQDIYKHFVSYSQDDPEQGARLFKLMSPSGQQAVKAGILGDALSAATDATGFTDPALVKHFLDSIPNATSKYITGDDAKMLQGLNNLIQAGAKPLGPGNIYYQRYMQAYGVENLAMGNVGKGTRQLISPAFYNFLLNQVYRTPRMKDFWLAASKLTPDSPQAAAAVTKFNRMVQQAVVGATANTHTVKQTTNSLEDAVTPQEQ